MFGKMFVETIEKLTKADPSVVTADNMDVREIRDVLRALQTAGVTRWSRKGWLVLDHPVLKSLTWKGALDGETFLLRVNGELVLRAVPYTRVSALTPTHWVAGRVAGLDPREVAWVEEFLGSTEEGGRVVAWRDSFQDFHPTWLE